MGNPPLTPHSCFGLKVYSEVILFENLLTDTKIRHIIHLGQHPAPKPSLPHALHFPSNTICFSTGIQPPCHRQSTPRTTVFSGPWGAPRYIMPTLQVVVPTLITSHRGVAGVGRGGVWFVDPETGCLKRRHIWPEFLFPAGSPAAAEICSMPLVINDPRMPLLQRKHRRLAQNYQSPLAPRTLSKLAGMHRMGPSWIYIQKS